MGLAGGRILGDHIETCVWAFLGTSSKSPEPLYIIYDSGRNADPRDLGPCHCGMITAAILINPAAIPRLPAAVGWYRVSSQGTPVPLWCKNRSNV